MNTHFPLALVLTLAPLLSQEKDFTISQQLPTGTRIEVLQGATWVRANVSEDDGAGAANIKIRTEPNNKFMEVPRKSIRIAPRPSALKVGDHVEWYDSGTFAYVPATITGLGSGNYAGYYLMTADKYPNSHTYTQAKNIWPLSEPPPVTAEASGPLPGKYRCLTYGAAGNPPIFIGFLNLRAGGRYTDLVGKEGRYSYDAASQNITWLSGNMQTSQFGGKVESNAILRVTRNTVCSHE